MHEQEAAPRVADVLIIGGGLSGTLLAAQLLRQPGRRHHFWECPVAQAVVGIMQQQLVGWMPGALQPHHVLCMRCPEPVPSAGGAPGPAVHKGVWRVVCLAAINAMDSGRRAANKLGISDLNPDTADHQF